MFEHTDSAQETDVEETLVRSSTGKMSRSRIHSSVSPLTVGPGNVGLAKTDNVATFERAHAAAFELFGSAAQLRGAIGRAAPR